jgi:hypothetical protein
VVSPHTTKTQKLPPFGMGCVQLGPIASACEIKKPVIGLFK